MQFCENRAPVEATRCFFGFGAVHVGPMLAPVGPCRPMLAPSWPMLVHVGPKVARVGSKLVPNWPQDGPCWLMLAPSWPQVGPCWLIRRTPECPRRPREIPEDPNRFSGASAGVPKASQGVPECLPRHLPRLHSPQNETFSRWFAFRCLVHLPGFSLGYSPG